MSVFRVSAIILHSVLLIFYTRIDVTGCQETDNNMSVAELFRKNEVVPDILDAAPKALAEVS